MTVNRGNFSRMLWPVRFEKEKNEQGDIISITEIPVIDTEYHNCNFSQETCINVAGKMQGVRIFPGDDTPRTFVDCNLVNVELPPGSTFSGCNTTILETGLLDSTNRVVINGLVIARENRKNRVHGRVMPDLSIEYKTPPVEYPVRTR